MFQVLTATNVKIAIVWDVALRSLIDTERRFKESYLLHHLHHPDDGDSKVIWNASQYLPLSQKTAIFWI
jgi:hypothetical protein